ncbi:MAG: sporulation protein YtfJ [Clostridiales bacterium]|nr:sporulation protein YtfJ [Clostridiales bacterium]
MATENHPIDGLMSSAMNSIKEMVDVNTIIGNPVNIPDGTVIIPISRVSFGFAAGGSEFSGNKESKLPFGGGSGAGVTINPVGFLVVGNGLVKFVAVGQPTAADKLVDYMPEAIEKIQGFFNKDSKKKEQKKYETPNGAVYVAEEIE